MEPGDYRFNIVKEGYEEISKAFSVRSGSNSLKIQMKSKNSSSAPIKEEAQKNIIGNPNSNIPSNNNNNNQNNVNQNSTPAQNQVQSNPRPMSSKNILIYVFDAITNAALPNVNIMVTLY